MRKTFEQGKEEIARLTDYFRTNRSAFLAPRVKEAHVRQSLIDPLFEALGWDVRNTARIAPQYREVVPEDSLEVEGRLKAPDYSFRVGPTAKFYAEAKRCGVSIGTDPAPAYQLRCYGWCAKAALSVLTNFEELSVYLCTLRPCPTDKASRARILYLHFEEYPDRWREIWDIFSREAVWSGSFDKFAESKRGKRGSSEVDDEFLKEIEGWRDELARNMAIRNPGLSLGDLNRAVQLTIDRIVFLRMAEDRRIEIYESLLRLGDRPDIYRRFVTDLCKRADAKYNSGLFDLRADKRFNDLEVDDKVLKPILQSLYFEHGSPYAFHAMPVEILGTVYERFLGRTITFTEGHRARIEEKPEVRKAGGVYYTPSYIVDYIVKNTVGKMIEGKSPAQLAGQRGMGVPPMKEHGQDARATRQPFRVLDMACGSGSFLLGAYQCLLDHYLTWYIEHKPETHKKAVYPAPRKSQGSQNGQSGMAVPAMRNHGQDAHATAHALLKIRQGAYLPHWTEDGATYAVTFRLADSLPQKVLEIWLFERENILKTARQMGRPLSSQEEQRLRQLHSEKVERYLDAGHGACWMKEDRIAGVVANALRHFDGERYDLSAWCVMPNHAHVVIRPRQGYELPDILHSWKSFSAKEANKALGRSGAFWQEEYYDHLIRDEEDFAHCTEYVIRNPEMAGLKGWKWVSGTGEGGMGEGGMGEGGMGVSPMNHSRDTHATVNHGRDTHATVNHGRDTHATMNHGRDAHATEWRLTIPEKKRILITHIFGVDIDPQAVEVAKLSLLLKVLEGEDEQSLGPQLDLFPGSTDRALPNLDQNIKCGNSLIGPDYFSGRIVHDPEEMKRVNPFDWNAEFPEAMRAGGFDCVIGNPPYGGEVREEADYLRSKYVAAPASLDTYFLFCIKALDELLLARGVLGYITPNTWELIFGASEFRRKILSSVRIKEIVHYLVPVFKQATVDCEIVIIAKEKPVKHTVKVTICGKDDTKKTHKIPQSFWQGKDGEPFSIRLSRKSAIVCAKIERCAAKLKDLFVVHNGVKPFEVGKGDPPQTKRILEEKPFVSDRRKNKSFRPLLRGSLIQRYQDKWNGDSWISYGPWLAAPRDPMIFKAPEKIVCRQTGDSIIATIINDAYICRNNLHIILPGRSRLSLRYLLGLMNSHLTNFYYEALNPERGEALAEVKKKHVEQLPVRDIDFSNPRDVAKHDRIVQLVESMLDLHNHLGSAKSDADKVVLQRQIDATDREIDQLVYALYGLTDEEIAIVESERTK